MNLWGRKLLAVSCLLSTEVAFAAISSPSASSDSTHLYYQFSSTGTPKFFRAYLDTDKNSATGYRGNGIGADYLLENGILYKSSSKTGGWGWSRLKTITITKSNSTVRWSVAKVDVNSPASLFYVFQTANPTVSSSVMVQTISISPSPSPTPTPTATPTPTPSPSPSPTPVSSGPTYYVSPTGNDLNAGTSASPWRTIQKAANSVSAGATVVLMDGTYEEPEIAFKRSGTSSAPITVRAQNKWQAIVSSMSGCQPGISLYASYIHLKDLRFAVSPRNNNCTIYTSANVHVRAWNTVLATPSNPTTGYVGFVGSGLKFDNANRSEGIKSNQDFTIIENCEASHSIELFGSLNSIVRNNISLAQSRGGIAILAKGGVRNAQIYGNIIHQKSANGRAIIIGGYSCDECHYDTATNIEAYNSIAYNNVIINESGGSIAALKFEGAKDSAFVNNVVINGMIGMYLGGHNTGPEAPTSNPTFRNNIVICSGTALTSGYVGWSYTGTLNADYNNFYNCTGAPAQAHPIIGNPMFVNPLSDWHLQAGSPAINSGAAFSMPAYGGGTIDISRDIDGILRSSPWDLGIYNVAP